MQTIQIGAIRTKIDATHVHIIQPDPITSAINWIVLTHAEFEALQQFVSTIKQ